MHRSRAGTRSPCSASCSGPGSTRVSPRWRHRRAASRRHEGLATSRRARRRPRRNDTRPTRSSKRARTSSTASREDRGREAASRRRLADELADDAAFLRKLKPSLIERAREGRGPDDAASRARRDVARPARSSARGRSRSDARKGLNPWLVVGGALVGGLVLAKVDRLEGPCPPTRLTAATPGLGDRGQGGRRARERARAARARARGLELKRRSRRSASGSGSRRRRRARCSTRSASLLRDDRRRARDRRRRPGWRS